MGRRMMSSTLDESPSEKDRRQSIPIIQMETSAPDLPHYEKWSASNAFDPDSDEFWQDQEVVYEAFVDDLSSPELSPSTSEESSDIDGNANPDRLMTLSDLERIRRSAEEEQPLRVEAFVGSDGRLRIRQATPPVTVVRQMEIMTSSTTVTDAQPPSASGDSSEQTPSFPAAPAEWVLPSEPIESPPRVDLTNLPQLSGEIMTRETTPPSPAFAEMWSDLRSLSHSPMPFNITPRNVPTTPNVAPSPAPSVTPHIYTWERSSYTPIPASPTPVRTPRRVSAREHRRRESLPASISLMT